MRFYGLDHATSTKVTGNISADAYKKLCEALKPLSKEELWKVLDHYIFHCMSDSDVEALVSGLKSIQKTGIPLTAEAALSLLELDYPVKALPTSDELEQSKNMLDILFDETYFESYTPPHLRRPTAQILIAFAKDRNLPQLSHWHFYVEDEV